MINQIQGIVIMTTMACAMCCAVESAEPKVDLPAPYGVTPSERQVKHAELEYYGFCHFTVDTFTDREWGLGTESESVFNPVQFDADQIVGAMKSAGMKGVILTCKHHDGFCLWPSEMTEHDIASSPYKTGKGDIVKEFADACSKAGIKFGVYLSPWDRNHPFYGKPEYIQVYRNQLRELLTGYGDIFEIWMDGANGGTGYYRGKVGPVEYKGELENRSIDRTTYYDWPNTWALMRELQPKAVLFSDVGPDIRWVGNERGDAGDPCRATINYDPGDSPGNLDISRLGTGDLGGKTWCQAEVDVSIRPGWFWHASQDMKVKSPEDLMEIYLKSVGRGATLLLNCPPDKRGLLHENDVDYQVASALASDVIAEKSFQCITESTYACAVERLKRCDTMLNCLTGYGETNRANQRLAAAAEQLGLRVVKNYDEIVEAIG